MPSMKSIGNAPRQSCCTASSKLSCFGCAWWGQHKAQQQHQHQRGSFAQHATDYREQRQPLLVPSMNRTRYAPRQSYRKLLLHLVGPAQSAVVWKAPVRLPHTTGTAAGATLPPSAPLSRALGQTRRSALGLWPQPRSQSRPCGNMSTCSNSAGYGCSVHSLVR